MAGPLPEKVGFGPCPNRYCKASAPVLFRFSSGAKKLTYKCDRCDTSGYADPGGVGYFDMLAAVTERLTDDSAEPLPAPVPKSKPTPPTKPAQEARGSFNLGQLT